MAHRRTSSPGSTSHRPEWRAHARCEGRRQEAGLDASSVNHLRPPGRDRHAADGVRWDISPAAWNRHACTVAGRELTARVAGRTSRATVPAPYATPANALPSGPTGPDRHYARHARAHGETTRLTIHTVRTTTTFEDKPGRPGAQQRRPAAASHEAISLRPPHRPLTAHRTRAGRPPDRVITCALRESERSGRGGKVLPVRRKAALSAHRVGRWWRSRCVDADLHECASLPDTATARVTSRFAASHAAGGDAAMVVVDGPMVPSAR